MIEQSSPETGMICRQFKEAPATVRLPFDGATFSAAADGEHIEVAAEALLKTRISMIHNIGEKEFDDEKPTARGQDGRAAIREDFRAA